MKKGFYILLLIVLPVAAFFAGKEFSEPSSVVREISNKSLNAPADNQITSEDANLYFNNYYSQASRVTTPLIGFSFTKPLVTNMLSVFDNLENVNCKLYFGIANSAPGYILVGADSSNIDLPDNGIFYYMHSDSVQSRVCPKACDYKSPIMCPMVCTKEDLLLSAPKDL